MCTNDSKERCCCHPERRKTDVADCSTEQIKECHGDVKRHPCERDKKENCRK